MKQPIHCDAGMLSAIIVAMLKERGETEFTLSLAHYEDLGLDNWALESSCETDGGTDDQPGSVTVTMITVEQAMAAGGTFN